jgi:hypothetical protein
MYVSVMFPDNAHDQHSACEGVWAPFYEERLE